VNIPNEYKYHLSTLSIFQQELYELMYKKISSYSNTAKLPFAHANEILVAFKAVLLDNPEIFYVKSYQYIKDLNMQTVLFKPEYNFSMKEMRQYQAALESSLSFIEAVRQKNDYEKVMHIHNFILANVSYDQSFSDISNSALGVALNKTAVCEGIAKYVKLALDCLSVKSIVVVGRATNPAFDQSVSEAHTWNMVEINGGWYHLDVTFDLTLKHKINRYDYFLVKDEDIKINHSTGNKLPPTSTKPMDYYFTNGLTVAKAFDLERLIYNGLLNGERVMQFKLRNVREGLNPCDKILRVAQEQCQKALSRSFSVEARYNNALWVFELEIT